MKILNNINLGKKTTIGIGGNAKFYCEIKRNGDFLNARNFAKKNDLGIIFFGIGSNILFSKDLDDKLICRVKNNFFEKIGDSSENGTHFNFEEKFFEENKEVFSDEKTIFALKNNFLNFNKNKLQEKIKNKSEKLNNFGIFKIGSGAILGNLINILKKDNFDLTCLAGFPSTIGGAIIGNAGLCGFEIKDFLISAEILNLETGKIENWENADFDFEYRSSKIKKLISKKLINKEDVNLKNNFAILDCILKIPQFGGENEELKNNLQENLKIRGEKQPKGRSAGSFFRNPEGDFAGRLIEKVGLKSKKIGGAFFSGKHANFLMTNEDVKISDILNLRNLAKNEVKKEFGIELVEEITIY